MKRAVKAVIAATALSVGLVATPVAALDGAGTPWAGLPAAGVPTNRVKNVLGRAVENACLRNGKAAAVCAAAAVAAGGIGLSRTFDSNWDGIKKVAAGAGSGALANAGAHCLIGGLIGGATSRGTGFVAGCTAGLWVSALKGAAFGAGTAIASVTFDGAIKYDANRDVVGGPSVATTGTIVNGQAEFFSFLPNNPTSSYQAAFSRFGFNQTFICDGIKGEYNWQVCVFFDAMLSPNRDGDLYGVIRDSDGWQPVPKMGFCSGRYRTPSCDVSGRVWGVAQAADGVQTTILGRAAGHETVLLRYDTGVAQVNSPPQIAKEIYNPIEEVPLWAMPFGGGADPKEMGKALADELVAKLGDDLLKAAGNDLPAEFRHPGTGTVVTPADVQKAYQDNPGTRLTVGDMVRPMADMSVGGGTAANPIPEPNTVVSPGGYTGGTTTGGTGTGTTTGTIQKTKEEADEDLDELGGVLGNPIQPVIDFISGPLAPFFSPTFDKVNGACPIWTVDLGSWSGWFLDHPYSGRNAGDYALQAQARDMFVFRSAPVCDFFDDWYTEIQLMSGLMLLICAIWWWFE